MTAPAPSARDRPATRPGIWDGARLDDLLTDVGEAGLRDILRLFLADAAVLQQQFSAAVAAGDASAAVNVLATLQDAAAALGLSALAELAAQLASDPLAPHAVSSLAQEIGRIRFIPPLAHAS